MGRDIREIFEKIMVGKVVIVFLGFESIFYIGSNNFVDNEYSFIMSRDEVFVYILIFFF